MTLLVENGKCVVIKVKYGLMALGALVQIGGVTVEDPTWLRKDRSEVHINMAELDAVRGVNMALAWKLNKLQLFTDSVTVFH